jgi:hypothetical protein
VNRRAAGRVLLGGAVTAALSRLGGEEAAQGKKRCSRTERICTRHRRCCSKRCCPPYPTQDFKHCAPKGHECCRAAAGGGSCPAGEKCCPPNKKAPEGYCCKSSDGPTVCCKPDAEHPFGYCCGQGRVCCPSGCCDPGAASAADASAVIEGTRKG